MWAGARTLNLEAERRRERIMRVQVAFPFGFARSRDGGAAHTDRTP